MTLRNKIYASTYDGKYWDIMFGYSLQWSGGEHTVEAGERTDFASVPGVLRWLFPPWGLSMRAAAGHDSIYRRPEVQITRAQADKMFLECMLQDGEARWRAWIMYLGVMLCGWMHYKKRLNNYAKSKRYGGGPAST